MSKQINNKYFFSAGPLVAAIILLPLIGLMYLSFAINPYSMENYEPTKEVLRLPEQQQAAVIAQQKSMAAIIGFANFLPAPLNRLLFALIPILSFFWLFLLFRKFGKDGIALIISDNTLHCSSYKGWANLKRTDITEIILESPSEIEIKTRLGHQYISTSTISTIKAKELKDNLDAWLSGNYELVETSNDQELAPIKNIPDIHQSLSV